MLWRQIQKFGIILISLMTLTGIGIWLHDPVQAAAEPLSKEEVERINKEFEANATDLERFQGNWVIAHVQSDNPKDKLWTGIVFIIKIDRIFPVTGIEKVDSLSKGLPFRLDPTTPVKQIDILDSPMQKTSSIPGIYRFKENRLEICTSSDGAPRPKEFSASNGSKRTFVILKRQDEPIVNAEPEKKNDSQSEILVRKWEAELARIRLGRGQMDLGFVARDRLDLAKTKTPEARKKLYETMLNDLNDVLQECSKPDPGETKDLSKQIKHLKELIAAMEAKEKEEFPDDPSAKIDAQKLNLARRWKALLEDARSKKEFDRQLMPTLEGIIADHLKLTQSGKDRKELYNSRIDDLEEVLIEWKLIREEGNLPNAIDQLKNLITQIKEMRQKEFPVDAKIQKPTFPSNDPNNAILNPKVLLQLVENNTKRWEEKLSRVKRSLDTVSSLLEEVRTMLIAELQGRSNPEDRLRIYQTWAKRLIDFKQHIDDNPSKWNHTPKASEEVWQTFLMIDAWARKEIPEKPRLKGSDPVGANHIQPKETRTDPSPEIRKMLEKRAALLEKNIKLIIENPTMMKANLSDWLKLIEELLETEFEMHPDQKARIQAMEKNLRYLYSCYEWAKALHEANSIHSKDVDRVEAMFLKTKIRLEKERGK